MVESITTPQYMIVGDIGGTNCRLDLLEVNSDQSHKTLFQARYKSQEQPSFPSAILQFLSESPVKDASLIKCAVIGIAGPVFGGQLQFQLNIKHWCPIKEKDV